MGMLHVLPVTGIAYIRRALVAADLNIRRRCMAVQTRRVGSRVMMMSAVCGRRMTRKGNVVFAVCSLDIVMIISF
jgi:hypothetical protein